MKKTLLVLVLALSLTGNAFAMEVPTNTVVQNLNGSQQLIKTFTLAPDADPEALVEDPFELEGFVYTFSDIVKEENRVEETERHTEIVTVETEKNDLAEVLEKLSPTLEYDDGTYQGTLALDHTSILTEAAGYTTKSSSLTETKTIGKLDRNDMSYVPATTIKNGVTLKLADVEWQVTGTDLVGEVLTPSSFQAIATYTGKSYYKAATGYVTTAEYVGEVTRDDVESVTYQLTYLGEKEEKSFMERLQFESVGDAVIQLVPLVLGAGLAVATVVLAIILIRTRRKMRQMEEDQMAGEEPEYAEQEEGETV